MPGRRTLTVPYPEDFAVTAVPQVCRMCEGDEEVAKNFAIDAPGRPEIGVCPFCEGTGQEPPLGRISFQTKVSILEVTLSSDEWRRFAAMVRSVEEQMEDSDG